MRFRFKLESVLRYRKRREDEAKRDYTEAQKKVDEALAVINEMSGQIDNARNEIAELQHQGGTPLHRIRQLNEFIKGQKVRLENKREKARELMDVAEKKRQELVQASQEKKMLEHLKERRRKEFVKEKRKKERKQSEDTITMRYGGGDKT